MSSEQDRTNSLESLCGGSNKAFRLLRIWEDCANPVWGTGPHSQEEKAAKRIQMFTSKAKQEGFSQAAIQTFRNLNGI